MNRYKNKFTDRVVLAQKFDSRLAESYTPSGFNDDRYVLNEFDKLYPTLFARVGDWLIYSLDNNSHPISVIPDRTFSIIYEEK